MCSEKANIERLSYVSDEDAFVYIGEFMGKPRLCRSDAWKKRPCVMKYWTFKDEINRQAEKQNFVLGDVLFMQFVIKMPNSWSKKKQEQMHGKPHQNKPDLDNCIKGVWDCLRKDDSSIHSVLAQKFWGKNDFIIIKNGVIDELLRDK
jgi:Holliday junction resolvase RusA-like endonuclease